MSKELSQPAGCGKGTRREGRTSEQEQGRERARGQGGEGARERGSEGVEMARERERGDWLTRPSTIKEMGRLIAWTCEHGHRAVCSGDLVEVEAAVKVNVDEVLGHRVVPVDGVAQWMCCDRDLPVGWRHPMSGSSQTRWPGRMNQQKSHYK